VTEFAGVSESAAVTIIANRNSFTACGPAIDGGEVATVLLDGRKLWSFRVSAARMAGSDLSIDWPAPLAERLSGRALLGLEIDGAVVVGSYEVTFDDSDLPLVIEDPATGAPLVVNKWGRLAPTFAGQSPTIIDDVLDEAERLLLTVRQLTDIELFVTGGTLLGPIRDGRIMPGDDDVDFAYLSRYENPSDVATESFRLERALVAHGYEVIRLSAGHLQIMYPGRSVTDKYYIDIFSYFVCNGWFYGTFHAREPARDVTLLPLRPLAVNDRVLPGPADPEQLLAAIYGARWRIPDPSFTFVTPPAALRRYRGWLDDYNMDRENWEDLHRAEIARAAGRGPSEFAVAVEPLLDRGSTVVELGCGLGADARYFAEHGHSVLAVDYSRPALAFASLAAADTDNRPRFERVNLNSTREVAGLRAECGRLAGPVQIYANAVFGAVSDKAADVTFLLLRHVLGDAGSRAFVQLAPAASDPGRQWTNRSGMTSETFESLTANADLAAEPFERDLDRFVLRRPDS
jgi:SAM-dependent methyltransferase